MNYTPEMTKQIIEAYQLNPCRETVDMLAEQHNKAVKSIIGKLSKEGVYRREVYKTKQGEKPITKAEIVEHIAEHLDLDSDHLVGLDKTPKQVLKLIENTLALASGALQAVT